MWPFRAKTEQRSEVAVTQSDPEFLRVFGLDHLFSNSSGETVTIETALGVPAIFSAVNFLSSTVAGLPLGVYKKTAAGREKATGSLEAILNGVANDEAAISAFDLFKWWMEQALTGGRGVLFIDRAASGLVKNLWPLDPAKLTIKRKDGKREYHYRDGKLVVYQAVDVLDLPFMLKADGLGHRSPIMSNREVIGMAQAMTRYGGAFFRNGGVPPFAVTGNFQSGTALKRAADDFDEAVRKAAKEARQALVLPTGLDIKPIGADPDKSQMIEAQRFMVEQIARIYSMPPVFLQDLSHGTFSNTEQQDLHFVKHTVKRWVAQIEQELNLKLFGREPKVYAEFNLDGLLRGDFKTRMDGYAQGVQNGILTPNEARELENRPKGAGGDRLYIQGATVPLEQSGTQQQGAQV